MSQQNSSILEANFALKLNQERAKDMLIERQKLSAQQSNSNQIGEKIQHTNPGAKKNSLIIFLIMLSLAFMNDIVLGYIALFFLPIPVLGQIIYIIAYILKFIFSVIIYIWVYISGSPDYSWKRLLGIFGSTCFEAIPVLGDILPTYLYLVINTYLSNKKYLIVNNFLQQK